jgi:uncharacterized protein YlbG (UPF0298 family)
MVLEVGYCEKCGQYTYGKLCEMCQINYFRKNFTDCANENEKIDNLIQEMQLKINSHDDIVFEWIPYNQFGNFKKIYLGGSAKVYSALWKHGSLHYDSNSNRYIRAQNKKVALKNIYNSQNIIGKFNEV